ncbi:MAG: radical SAM protein [Planctomycetota bacterium]
MTNSPYQMRASNLGQRPTVCLIVPPSAFLLDERVFMSLGLLKVAAVCEQAGFPVEVLDLSGVENYMDALDAQLESSQATYYGVTSTTPQMPSATAILERIRSVRPDARTILGGPHPTLVFAARRREVKLQLPGRGTKSFEHLTELADTVVCGDGEEAIFLALSPNAPAVIDADDPKGDLFLTRQQLEQLPLAARHLVDISSYNYEIDGYRATSLIAQLGCPFACGFCGGRESAMLRRPRLRATEGVIRELEHLHTEYGFRGFMFYDDELNVNPQIVELMQEITALQKRHNTDFRLRGFVKSELFTEEQAAAMYEAGFRWILVGFESGSPRILTNINKKATREDNSRCVEIAHKHGLKVKALMSVGHPGESQETIQQTRDWLLEAQPDDFDVTIITTYPGTPYFDRAEPAPFIDNVWVYTYPKTGDKLYAEELDYTTTADYYKGDPNGGYRSFVFTDYLSQDDLVRLRDKTEREVREQLDIPFNPSAAKVFFEHSMGASGPLPPSILRKSSGATAKGVTATNETAEATPHVVPAPRIAEPEAPKTVVE